MDNAPRSEAHKQLTPKLRLAATAQEPAASDMRRRELAITQLNLRNAFGIADAISGVSMEDSQPGDASKKASR